ncbi:MAG: AAA family ATPase [Tenericutes bacterium]|nr:AAA family ATPase [Mycoplasmatota bacterium]
MKYYNRNIETLFNEYANNFKAVLITGPRQVGKSTFLKNIKEPGRKYVTLDDLELRALANKDPKTFINKYLPPVIIDEIQYAPKLLSYIKMICDNTNDKNLYWLTGSQKIQIMKNVSETLVGRMGVLDMYSLSNREMNNNDYFPLDLNNLVEGEYLSKSDVLDKMFNGSMPDVIYNGVKREYFYDSYVDLYIERDIRELKEVQNLETFRLFIAEVASHAGQLINYTDIASSVGINDKTVKTWISVLENTGIIKLIYQFKKDEFKRKKTHPKLVFMDTGLCIYLLGIKTISRLKEYTFLGNLFESYVISEIIKNNVNYNLELDFSYYRDRSKREIDLIITDKESINHLYEIKMNDKVDIRMIKNFEALSGSDVGTGGIICTCHNIEKLDNKNVTIPISAIID